MMKNIEIEFKTKITESTYKDLLSKFHLENNVFKQVNYYFDSENLDLNKEKIVLRIRQKNDRRFKVTLKKQSNFEAYEYHVLLQADQAKQMLESGFNTKDFFEDIDYFVTFKVALDNYRASTPFANGTLFLDRNEYSGITDYEIEYEVDHYEEGMKVFNDFLTQHQITFTATQRKSERALNSLIKNKL